MWEEILQHAVRDVLSISIPSFVVHKTFATSLLLRSQRCVPLYCIRLYDSPHPIDLGFRTVPRLPTFFCPLFNFMMSNPMFRLNSAHVSKIFYATRTTRLKIHYTLL